jgi:hypothetical protein
MLQESDENPDFERAAVASPAEDEGDLICRTALRSVVVLTAFVIHFFQSISVYH